MARRDTAQDIDRPHFYSQYWLDIAMGKHDVTDEQGASAAMDLDELEDDDVMAMPEIPAPKAAKKPAKVDRKTETARPTFTSLADLANIDLLMKNSAAMEGDEVTDLEKGTIDDLAPFDQAAASETPFSNDLNFGSESGTDETFAANEDEDDFGLDFEDEEEEDEWGSRKPGKGKPKPPRRERRPNF